MNETYAETNETVVLTYLLDNVVLYAPKVFGYNPDAMPGYTEMLAQDNLPRTSLFGVLSSIPNVK